MFQLASNPVARYRVLLEGVFGSALIPGVVAVALLLAAFLKGYALATEDGAASGVLGSRWFLTLLVLYEAALSVWLGSGLHARAARIGALLTFLAFFQVALYQALSGESSCGCLGKVSISPWVMVVVDVIALAALLVWSPAEVGPTLFSHRRRFAAVATIYLLAAVPGVINMVDYAPTGQMRLLRSDPLLAHRVKLQVKEATPQQILDQLHAATGLSFSIEDQLSRQQPRNLGQIATSSARAWALMELLAQRQPVCARWEKIEGGYRLVRAARMGRLTPWLVSGLAFVALAIWLAMFHLTRRQKQERASWTDVVYWVWQPCPPSGRA